MVARLGDVGFDVLTKGQKRPMCGDPSLQPLPVGGKTGLSSTVGSTMLNRNVG
jgi:hypothetical protein